MFDLKQFILYGILPSVIASVVFTWCISKISIFRNLRKQLESMFMDVENLIHEVHHKIELSGDIIKRCENAISIVMQLKYDFVTLHKTAIKFPDTSRFRDINGVYFYVGVDGIHSKDSPLCPDCLIDRKKMLVLQKVFEDRNNYSCKCGYKIPWGQMQNALNVVRNS